MEINVPTKVETKLNETRVVLNNNMSMSSIWAH